MAMPLLLADHNHTEDSFSVSIFYVGRKIVFIGAYADKNKTGAWDFSTFRHHACTRIVEERHENDLVPIR